MSCLTYDLAYATKLARNKKSTYDKKRKCLILLVRPAGFEPATYGFVVRHSIR